MSDFRSDPMPSAEGRGRARRAWEAYARVTNKVLGPAIEMSPLGDALRSVSANAVSDQVGFWMLWQLHGGFEGLLTLGMSRSSIYRKVATFRRIMHAHPDEFTLPGVELDVAAYLRGGGKQEEDKPEI
jgi:hypothetical protein